MDDELVVRTAEVIPAPATPGDRDSFGRFVPGNKITHRGAVSLNRLTRLIKERLADAIASGEKKHPAEILLDIANDPEEKTLIKMRAAAELMPYLMPQKHSLEVELPEPADEVRIQKTKRMLAQLWIEETTTHEPNGN